MNLFFLIIGLWLFVGSHSEHLAFPRWRARFIAHRGEKMWKLFVSVRSLVGLVLIVYGYGLSRADPVFLWNPPVWTRHIALPLTLLAFILFAASKGPPNHIKQKIGHPMYAGVKVWALAHLLANGRLGDVLLFGTLLLWAVAGFAISRRRDRRSGVHYPAGVARNTVVAVILGSAVWALFAFWLHRVLIGVPPI
ncbi:MAG: NnrU family protein [Gammaproteobacteria bacterium]